ncbi:CotH kinase family protein [Flavobacterium rakeshii]|uniref:CotH kinase family protein n=1 Tax=Flavobacterium rakeshii TaxID=1038845 RepID=UPI002E7BD8C2|nr:CotH kinase family protein [Flavobacterium rakeshii]MEE1897937.1 CotH kinase family protein [Flavobacterium rakeshii]
MKKYFFVLLLLLFFAPFVNGQTLVINEVVTSNSQIITDEDGDYEDWIELYNAGLESINLQGYGLSDNNDLFQWVFPSKTIAPGEYLLLWCSGKDKTDPLAPMHSNFKISADGETITLTSPEGGVVDSQDGVIIPQNFSYGRQPDGGNDFMIFPVPTPGESNTTEGYSEILEAPLFSVASGFYNEGFNLVLTANEPDALILYTLDGSEPDENNLGGTTYQYKNQYPQNPGNPVGVFLSQSFITYSYNGPIVISNRSDEPNKIASISSTYDFNPAYIPDFLLNKSTTVRAKVVKNGAMSSRVVTANYFVSPQGGNWFSLPVACINLSENLFFDYEEGIYVAGKDFDDWRAVNLNAGLGWCDANFKRNGSDAEVKGNFSYYENGMQKINQDVGIRIHGGTTSAYSNKSLRLYARAEFGEDRLDYSFFGEDNDGSFKRIILRNSGNDFATTYFLDAFIHNSVKHLHFDTQDYQPTVTFINGEYWGMLNLRERYDKYYFERVYDIPEDEIDYLELAGQVEIKEGDANHYNALIDYLEGNTLEEDENYNYVITQIDPVNFADYYITEIYIDNLDWLDNNVELFRRRTAVYNEQAPYGSDGRWRWILKDTDVAFGLAGSFSHNTLAMATEPNGTSHPNPSWATLSFRRMLENQKFRNYFINRFADLLNTAFLPERMQGIYDGMKQVIVPEIEDHSNRWLAIPSVQDWDNYTGAIINFATQRPAHQREHIQQEFDISGTVSATLNVSDTSMGYIKMNTININGSTPGVEELPYPWNGIYFYNIPLTIKALPLPGYVFSHWTGDITGFDEEVVFTPTQDFSVVAHFIPAVQEPEAEVIYFWLFDGNIPNDTPLTEINTTYPVSQQGVFVSYVSCLEGYPFNEGHPEWRIGSMERRNKPTEINYQSQVNNDKSFEESGMKAIQIKQPFQFNEKENALLFNISTIGYKKIKFAFAAMDEGAANNLVVDYSLSNEVEWITTGMETSSFLLTDAYQLFEIDFSTIQGVANNENFKIRVRFEGDDMTVDNGKRVTFNNIGLLGVPITAEIPENNPRLFTVYPNPVSNLLYIKSVNNLNAVFSLYALDGKLVSKGDLTNGSIDVSFLEKGMYILNLSAGETRSVIRIIKK